MASMRRGAVQWLCAACMLTAPQVASGSGNLILDLTKIIAGPDPPVVDSKAFVDAGLEKCTCLSSPDGCAQGPQTLVTGILSIHKPGRSFDSYVEHFKWFLSLFPETPTVAFVQRGFGEELAKSHPHGPRAKTLCLLELDISEVPENTHVKEYARIMLDLFKKEKRFLVPETVLPAYDIVTNAKVPMTARAAKHNPFGSDVFAWLDGGLHYPMSAYIPRRAEDLHFLTCGDRVCIGFQENAGCKRDHWFKKYKDDKRLTTFDCNDCEDGATFTGTRQAMLNLAGPYSDMLRDYRKEGIVDADQGPMMQLWLHRGDLVKDCGCKGFKHCSGYMLGAHTFPNASKLLWDTTNCPEQHGGEPQVV